MKCIVIKMSTYRRRSFWFCNFLNFKCVLGIAGSWLVVAWLCCFHQHFIYCHFKSSGTQSFFFCFERERDNAKEWVMWVCLCQLWAHAISVVVIRLRLLNMWKQVNQWYLVDISMAWMHWSKTRNLFPLPSVIIFWWLVCLSEARYQPNILSQSPVCTRCSINPMNRPFDWWGTAQECWEIGKVRGSRVSEWKRWEWGGSDSESDMWYMFEHIAVNT